MIRGDDERSRANFKNGRPRCLFDCSFGKPMERSAASWPATSHRHPIGKVVLGRNTSFEIVDMPENFFAYLNRLEVKVDGGDAHATKVLAYITALAELVALDHPPVADIPG